MIIFLLAVCVAEDVSFSHFWKGEQLSDGIFLDDGRWVSSFLNKMLIQKMKISQLFFAFVRCQQQHCSKNKCTAYPAESGKIFVPKQPNPQSAKHGFQVASYSGTYKADSFQAHAITKIGYITSQKANNYKPKPNIRLMIEVNGFKKSQGNTATNEHIAINGGCWVARLPPAVERVVSCIAKAREQTTDYTHGGCFTWDATPCKTNQRSAAKSYTNS